MAKIKNGLALCEVQCNVVLSRLEKFKDEDNYEKIKKFYQEEKSNILKKTITNKGRTAVEGAFKMNPKQFARLVTDWCETEEEVREKTKELEKEEEIAENIKK